MSADCLQVTVAAPSREEADRLAGTAVTARLAACGQVIGPASSTYWWDGRVQQAEEWLCILKTTGTRYPELEAHLRSVHSHQNPEIIATPVAAASEDYLTWLHAETAARTRESP
ncbi:MAG TPA: divalent-cation tolerance protein CutA [Gemmatimonadales bacterium]|nr:divalent-cation tolerance protein CutA [Gemmatimonadales bacterium]